jgi:hypothetical protein
MALSPPKKREAAQLLLVAREYLELGSPPAALRDIRMSANANAFTKKLVTNSEWSQTMLGAHLTSAAVRLASIDAVLKKGGVGRATYIECLTYFSRNRPTLPARDNRAQVCSEWFHVMLRDAIAHEEPQPSDPDEAQSRYETRQNLIEETTFGAAYAQLRQTADELAVRLRAHRIVLPSVEAR